MTVKKTALSILMIAGFAFLFSHCGSQGKSEDTSQPKSQTAKSKQQPHSPQSPEPVSANITLIESTLTLSPGENRKIPYRANPDSLTGRLPWLSSDTAVVQCFGDSLAAKAPGEADVTMGKLRNYALDYPSMAVKVVEKRPWSKDKTSAKPLAGNVRILSVPAFAQIQVDGEEWGETPMTAYKTIPAGSHRIQLKHRNYPARDTVVYVGQGARIKIKMNLKDVTAGKN